ncbi:MAG: arginine deiminase family protein [Hyphomonadaceae bacterium]
MSLAYTHAFVRRFPQTYPAHYFARGRGISLDLCAAQHDAYAAALRHAGLNVVALEADESTPDCVFIEDTAVLWGKHALSTRPRPPRTAEAAAVAAHLRATHDVTEIPDGAFLEGGDVFSTERATFVGLSSRTNQAGVDALRRFMAQFGRETIAAPIEKAFHLKSAVTYLGDDTIAIAPFLVDAAPFARFEQIEIDADEHHGANAIRARDTLIVSENYPKARRKLETWAGRRGLDVIAVQNGEFEKGDGAITCLSLLWG